MSLDAFNKASVKLIKCPNTVVSDAIHTKSNAMVKSLVKTARWLIARSAIIPSKIERRQLEKGLLSMGKASYNTANTLEAISMTYSRRLIV